MSDSASKSSDDGVVLIEWDDISNYNPDQILPESSEQIQKIRTWLNPTEYALASGEFSKHLASHLPGTNAWFTSSDAYRGWLKSKKDGLMWIKGIPGSGKSVLAAHLVNELAQFESGTPVLYFFFRQIIDANHEAAALIRDWLDQILVYSPPLQKRLKELVESGRSVTSITMEDHWSNLKLAINGLPGQIFCVADALDEMDEGNDDFLRSLAAFGQWKPDKAKVLITSRPVPIVELPLRNLDLLSIRLHEKEVDIDIETYVEHGLRSTDIAPSDQRLIKEAIPGRANGLFLYAKLALDAFLESGARIDDVLQALPTDLHDMYTRLLREHAARSGVPHDIQLLVLQWVTHATRPLRLLELAEMLDTTYPSEAESDLKAKKNLVRAATGPLLEILPDETVCVIHHSFTEYLKSETRDEGHGGYPILRPGPTHGRLAIACLSYLQSGCLDAVDISGNEYVQADNTSYKDTACSKEEQQIRLRYPFFLYAATNWHTHVARSASAGLPQAELNTVVHSFLHSPARRKAWLRLQWSEQIHSPTALHVAARYGLYDYAQYLVQSGADVDVHDVSGKTPLWLAASSGHPDIIRLLVHAGADPDVDDEVNGLKPLHIAAHENQAEAVRALLEAGVDPLTERTRDTPAEGFVCGNGPTSVGHTPLMYACKNGHLEALSAFIPFLHDLEAVHRALEWSAYKGRVKLVRRILQYPGVQVNAKPRGDTALVAACRSSNRDTIVTLIHAGADPTVLCENWGPEFGDMYSGSYGCFAETTEERVKRGFTALHALCSGFRYGSSKTFNAEESQELVTLLIDKGANVNQKEHQGDTPLHYAVNTPVAVRLLLEAGAEANAVNDAGQAPLHLVTSPESISLLVEIGHADINTPTRYFRQDGQSPIWILLNSYHVNATLKLLDYGPDLTQKDKDGSGPLHFILKQSSADVPVLKALLDAGADPNERNHLGETPLLCMLINGRHSEALLDLLLEAGADINAKDVEGLTVLSRGVSGGSSYDSEYQELEALLKKGADLDVRDFDGRTLLHIAISGHEDTRRQVTKFDYLLQKGMDHTAVDYRGNTLLHKLAPSYARKYLPLARQLLALGIDPDQRNNAGRTALHVLASRLPSGYRASSSLPGPRNIFELLISTSKNINLSDSQGLTALHLASTVSERHVKILLDAGSDATIASFQGLTPLHRAARAGKSNIVGQILEAGKTAKRDVVNLKDEKGHTALYYACRSGRPETVKLLLDAGADASDRSLFTACADYEEAGPTSTFYTGYSSKELKPYKDTTRLDEILTMLIDNGANVRDMHYVSPSSGATEVSDYSVDCFVRAKELYTGASMSNSDGAPSILFTEHAAKIRRDAQLRAVSEFNVVKGQQNWDLILHLLQQRQYHTMEVLFHKGVSFLEDVDKYSHRSNMHVFVRLGFASLVQQIGDLEAEREFEKGQWHAFNDSSRRGLHIDVDPNADKSKTIPSLLEEAVKNSLPNMDVVRLLVERFHVGVDGVMHYLAMGIHWWHVAQALPYLILQGANVNIRDQGDHGRSPLHVALAKERSYHDDIHGIFQKEAATVLISAGADVNAQDKDGKSCLALACDDSAMVKLLIQKGATVDAHALFAALKYKLVDVLETLLSTGVDPNIRRPPDYNSRGHVGDKVSALEEFPLWVAATRHGIEAERTLNEKRKATDTALKLVNLLLAHGADPFAMFEKKNPSHVSKRDDGAIEEEGHDSSLISAEELDAESELQTVCILHDLLENDSLVHPLLTLSNLDPQRRDSRGRTVLHAACRSRAGIRAPIDTLLTEIDPEREDPGNETPSFLHHLSSRGADVLAVDNDGRNILHHMLAAPKVHLNSCHPMLRVLALLSKADTAALINQTDVYGNTAIHLALRYAIWQSDATLVEALLAAGADPSVQDNRGNNALHILAYRVLESEATRVLFSSMLEHGLDVNTRNASGQTPVFNLNKPFPSYIDQVACNNEEYITPAQTLALFEDAGADLFLRDKQGRGLLHFAARWTGKNRATRFELLVNKGLDAMIEDERKRTALDVAAACDNQSVLKLFDKDNVRNKVTAEELEFEPEYESDGLGF
ncbi:uncharacterized protein N0V89_004550 [Didymosphaeria variabile]|uniref:NACHT domain-containing protein n=1 Tax=Didymosphaeria variabile TaxID=1932322 RepID=A0A9W9CDP2_9PLEO|nr:uncharacterized protein N0V89_004550 [Didymosphaeria variabile]KAJ4356516.1 hypothetical protein N0V89_004550 [Didymosphaeria variabile]